MSCKQHCLKSAGCGCTFGYRPRLAALQQTSDGLQCTVLLRCHAWMYTMSLNGMHSYCSGYGSANLAVVVIAVAMTLCFRRHRQSCAKHALRIVSSVSSHSLAITVCAVEYAHLDRGLCSIVLPHVEATSSLKADADRAQQRLKFLKACSSTAVMTACDHHPAGKALWILSTSCKSRSPHDKRVQAM